MRVLHVIPAVATRYGGPGVVAIETVRALRASGVDAMIATTDADGSRRLPVALAQATEWKGVPAVVMPLGGGERYKWSGALARWLSEHVIDFDLVDVHAVFSHSSIAAARACRRARVPYVVRPHGALDPWSLTQKSWQKRLLMWCGGHQMLAGATFMQYTTEAERSGAERMLPWLPAGHVVALGVDDALFGEPAPDTTRPFVLAMSRLEAKKSLDLLIAAFHQTATGPLERWRLVIAGAGDADYVASLRRRASDGAAAGRIEFPGWVHDADKAGLLSRASLFASPSAQENFGLSLVEAMAAGVPVLITPGVNLSQSVASAEAGWVVDRDAEAIAVSLGRILRDDAAREARGRAARRLAERFRWRHSAAAAIDLYQAALTAPRDPHHA